MWKRRLSGNAIKRKFSWIWSISMTGGNKKSGWEDHNETIVAEQEVQYELLDVEDEKFYRGKKWMLLHIWKETFDIPVHFSNKFKTVSVQSIIFLTTNGTLNASKCIKIELSKFDCEFDINAFWCVMKRCDAPLSLLNALCQCVRVCINGVRWFRRTRKHK